MDQKTKKHTRLLKYPFVLEPNSKFPICEVCKENLGRVYCSSNSLTHCRECFLQRHQKKKKKNKKRFLLFVDIKNKYFIDHIPFELAKKEGGNRLVEKTQLCESNSQKKNPINGITLISFFRPTKELLEFIIEQNINIKEQQSFRKITPFHFSCTVTKPSIELIKFFLKQGASVHDKDFDGKTAFHYLCSYGKPTIELIEFFLQQGASVHDKGPDGKTALHCLCRNEQITSLEPIKFVLDQGADLTLKVKSNKKTALHFLCKNQNATIESIEFFLEKGASVHDKDSNGNTPAHCFCKYGQNISIESIQFFLDQGFDLNQKNNSKKTVFINLCVNKHSHLTIELIQFFLDHKLPINKSSHPYSQRGLHYFCDYGSPTIELIEFFLKQGASLDDKDSNGKTAFHYLCRNGNVYIALIQFFLDQGFDINQKDELERTPLHYLCSNKNISIELIQFFVDKGAKFNEKDYDEKNELHFYCTKSHARLEIIKFLCDNGSDIHLKDCWGCLPFHYLIGMHKDITIELLNFFLGQGVELSEPDYEGKTPMFYLLMWNNPSIELLQFLVSKGGDLAKKNDRGKTVFRYYCKNTNVTFKMLHFLLQNGISVNDTDKNGQNILHEICEFTPLEIELIQLCINNCGDINQKDDKNETAFQKICRRTSDLKIIQLFLESHADKMIKNGKKKTPLKYCLTNKKLKKKYKIEDIKQLFSINWNCFTEDFKQYYTRKDLTDFEVYEGIRIHKLFLESRINNKSVNEIKKIFEQYPQNIIEEFLKWAYYDEIPVSIAKFANKAIDSSITDQNKTVNKKSTTTTTKKKKKIENLFQELEIPISISQLKTEFCLKKSIEKLFYNDNSKDFRIIFNDKDDKEKKSGKEKENEKENEQENEKESEKEKEKEKSSEKGRKKTRKLKVHKFILQCRSELFRGLFLSIKDPNINQINDYSGRSIESMEIFIEYLYTDKINPKYKLTEEIVEELQEIADYYQLNVDNSLNWLLFPRFERK
ncbi:ankyrin repeat ph and sec7 domain containing protein secg-related [Anaeramoeba flamelloides]|uniref:Ankyrin repeat ph and sec7 domain containing protein secg-related n=1 Tax=Anaeramoeba flamelloides TaxID=1746091 RepID=A0AAV7Y9V2_9EUKA|nr:ankyrin repeat ph and sec7 domain containing protein secg-related [Anaeramoeba flamelloides]